ncbi:NUDIX hydrolase [Streptomyces griseorubiginosus]|uniref:NUDIX hydrolase n=1 Tax=Streptomyces griseorubiginosus TaxID=67304 RepID=UPI00113FCAB7|nr:NUDIX domain-containing protein [Streptomyces griseorubiginosus]
MTELLEAEKLRLVEVAPPSIPSGTRAAIDREWAEAVLANPALFDGPVALCAGLSREAGDALLVSWSRTTYRYFALRRVPGATVLRSLFVSVIQPTDDGRVLVGRMSRSTAAPGRWQFPGGSVEPPTGAEPLDEGALCRHAALELAEETGVDIPVTALTRCLITYGDDGQVGVHYLAPPLPAPVLQARFDALAAAEAARGRDPEFDRIVLVATPAELPRLEGPHVVYLEPVLRWTSRRVGS